MRTAVIILAAVLLLTGCEELRRGRPGTSGYIAPKNVSVTVVEFVPERIEKVSNGTVLMQPYSVVHSEEGKRYRLAGKVGEVGDTFVMDVSLLKAIGE